MRQILAWLTIFSTVLCSTVDSTVIAYQQPPSEVEQLRFAKIDRVGSGVQLSASITRFYSSELDVEISLVSAPAYGTQSYFDRLNGYLNDADIVFYEYTGGPSFLRYGKQNLQSQIANRKARGDFLAQEILRFATQSGRVYPETLNELISKENLNSQNEFIRRAIADDGFGRPWKYEKTESGFRLSSPASADGDPVALNKLEIDQTYDGLSDSRVEFDQSVADTVRLANRLLGWRKRQEVIPLFDNKYYLSDITRREFKVPAGEKNVEDKLFPGADRELNPNSSQWAAQQAKLRMQMIQANDPTKIPWSFQNPRRDQLGAVARKVQEKIVMQRNDIVMRDIEQALALDKPPKKIAIVYGVENMYDLSERIVYLLDFEIGKQDWLVAGSAKIPESRPARPRLPGETDF